MHVIRLCFLLVFMTMTIWDIRLHWLPSHWTTSLQGSWLQVQENNKAPFCGGMQLAAKSSSIMLHIRCPEKHVLKIKLLASLEPGMYKITCFNCFYLKCVDQTIICVVCAAVHEWILSVFTVYFPSAAWLHARCLIFFLAASLTWM